MADDFEPKILGFLCNWCSYAGADLAGINRIQYPTNVKIIRTMCSGRIEPRLVIEAFLKGADGVIITGCHPGDCHYQTGNTHTKRRYDALTEVLGMTSFEPRRLRLEWVSASEAARFGEVITSFTEQVKALGPNPIKSGDERAERVRKELRALKALFSEHAERTLVGKSSELIEAGNVYGDKIDPERLEEIVRENVRTGFIRNYILVSCQDSARTVGDISSEINIEPERIVKELSVLMRRNMLAITEFDGRMPRFTAIVQEAGA